MILSIIRLAFGNTYAWSRADDDSWGTSATRIGAVGTRRAAHRSESIEALLASTKARGLAGTKITSKSRVWRQRLVARVVEGRCRGRRGQDRGLVGISRRGRRSPILGILTLLGGLCGIFASRELITMLTCISRCARGGCQEGGKLGLTLWLNRFIMACDMCEAISQSHSGNNYIEEPEAVQPAP